MDSFCCFLLFQTTFLILFAAVLMSNKEQGAVSVFDVPLSLLCLLSVKDSFSRENIFAPNLECILLWSLNLPSWRNKSIGPFSILYSSRTSAFPGFTFSFGEGINLFANRLRHPYRRMPPWFLGYFC